jgi:XTP/dITP diphosphohydrolase
MRYYLYVGGAAKYERILIATTNRGKAKEIAVILKGCASAFIGLDELSAMAEPIEDGETFAANALIKSRYYAEGTGLPSVADDSGLMVDALGGAPGVLSSRLVEAGAGDAARNEVLLRMLEGVTDPDERRARFVCAACFVDPESEVVIIEEGILHGRIAFSPEGSAGFGFDPLFIPDGYERSVASLGLEVKNEISHRRAAFAKLARRIETP